MLRVVTLVAGESSEAQAGGRPRGQGCARKDWRSATKQRQLRARIVLPLIESGELDPFVGLSYVVWPTRQIAAATKEIGERLGQTQTYRSEETRLRALELLREGSQRKVGEMLGGISRSTILEWSRKDRRSRGVEPSVEDMPAGFREHWEAEHEREARPWPKNRLREFRSRSASA